MKFLRALLVSAAAVPLLAACQGIRSAPEGSPRVEVEVVLAVGGEFFAPLEDDVDHDEILDLIHDTAIDHADVGLRFYPVRSSDYGKDDARPPYLMVLLIQDLDVEMDHRLVEAEDAEPWIETGVRAVKCTAYAEVNKRRTNGPPLVVGSAQKTGDARMPGADEPIAVEASFPLRYVPQCGDKLRIPREVLIDAVDEALVGALAGLQKPIDREFAIL